MRASYVPCTATLLCVWGAQGRSEGAGLHFRRRPLLQPERVDSECRRPPSRTGSLLAPPEGGAEVIAWR